VFALVHISSKNPSEKLAILNNYLKGDLVDIVQGHGGGEAGYKEILQRLKSSRFLSRCSDWMPQHSY
jgi:hypothetical protein